MSRPTDEGRRSITLPQGIGMYVGAVLGTGIIALPAIAADVAGPASLVAWAALAVVSASLAAVFAALARRYPDAGGVSTFVRAAYGAYPAAATGVWFYTAAIILVPALGLFGGTYVASATGGGPGVAVAVCAVMLAITLGTNALGVRVSGSVQLALTGCLAVLLVVVMAVSVPHLDTGNLRPFLPHGWLGVAAAASLLVWSFAGWEVVTHLAGEFRDPDRSIVRAGAAAVGVIAVLYLGVAATVVLVLGPSAGREPAPLGALMRVAVGPGGEPVAAVLAVFVALATMNVNLSSAAKLGAALGRENALPRWFARGQAPGEVPRRSLAVLAVGTTACLAVTEATGLEPAVLVRATSALLVSVYIAGTVAGVRLLPRGGAAWWASLAAVAFAVVLLVLAGWYLLLPIVAGVCAVGFVFVGRRRRASQSVPT